MAARGGTSGDTPAARAQPSSGDSVMSHEPPDSGESPVSRACARARDAAVATSRRLAAAQIAPEERAAYVPPGRRFFLLPRPATMRPLGQVWRLGTVLLGQEGEIFALGQATRAAERGRVGYQSVSREARRDIAAAALHGGYPVGTPVNFDSAALPLHADAIESLDAQLPDAPIGFADGEIRVRWRAGAPLSGAPTLAEYLEERAGLLIRPPLS